MVKTWLGNPLTGLPLPVYSGYLMPTLVGFNQQIPRFRRPRDLCFMRILEAKQKYLAWRQTKKGGITCVESSIRSFLFFTKNCHIEEVTIEDIDAWEQLMDADGMKRNTIITRSVDIRSFFTFFYKRGYKVLNPESIELSQYEYREPNMILVEEFKKLIAAIKQERNKFKRYRALVLVGLLYHTGMRIRELLSLNKRQVVDGSRKCTIKTLKSRGRKPHRMVAWSAETQSDIYAYLVECDLRGLNDEALYVAERMNKRLSPHGARDILKKYALAAGLKKWNPHAFRHGKITRALEDGAPIMDALDISGHARIDSLMPYWHRSSKRTEQILKQYV